MATIVSAQAGLWSSTTTWVGGILPAAADTVTITHSITYDLDDAVTKYGRIDINTNGAIIHDNTKPTTIVCSKFLHVNGGTYQAGPNSKTLFYTTSKTSAVEGVGLAGIYAQGGVAGTKLILEGSIPNPEVLLTTAVAIGDTVLSVEDASGFSAGEYISVYRDIKNDSTWTWNGTNQSDEGFIVHHVVGNDIFIQQRVAVDDVTTAVMGVGVNTVTVSVIKKWQPGFKVWIDDEIFTISAIDDANNRIVFTAAATVEHANGAKIIETGAQKVHAIGDKVYKIATVSTIDTAINAASLTVANATKLEIGDRIAIEGTSRGAGYPAGVTHETIITAKTGNVLTVSPVIPYTTQAGFIVTKTNRDCLVSTTDLADVNRTFIYYLHGSSAITGRKCVLRYVEVSHISNSSSTLYAGVVLRGDFNRTDTEREMRGCVVRDGWLLDRSGVWAYSSQYFHYRNNAVIKCYNGLQPFDGNGTSFYNNLSMGNGQSGYRYESLYYYNQFQYNIATNSQYPVIIYSDFNSTYPEWHNLFRHHERGLFIAQSAWGQQYGSWMKNRYEDIQYLHHYTEALRTVVQDIEIRKPTTTTAANQSSAYANYDDRHLVGGMLIIVNKDFVRGQFEMHAFGGWISKDTVMQMGNGWSYKFNCNHTTADTRISQVVYCKAGIPVRATAYMRKNATYNGTRLPYIMARGNYLGEVFSHMQNVNDQWVRVDLNFTPTRGEMIQVGIGARGSTGNAWIDPRVSVTTHDLDLINGPYSVNLMFGLEEYEQIAPSIVLGGGMTL